MVFGQIYTTQEVTMALEEVAAELEKVEELYQDQFVMFRSKSNPSMC